MAFAITAIGSNSHPVQSKRVGTKATVRLVDTSKFLESDFVLAFQMEMPHTSRMWVEHDVDERADPAVMVAFYPRMPSLADTCPDVSNPTAGSLAEYTLFLDRSASMKAGGTLVCVAVHCPLAGALPLLLLF